LSVMLPINIGLPHRLTADCRRIGKGQAAVRVAHGSVPMRGDSILLIPAFRGKTR
jgi:hypothetical protein